MALGGPPVHPGGGCGSGYAPGLEQRVKVLEGKISALEKYVNNLYLSQCGEAGERLDRIIAAGGFTAGTQVGVRWQDLRRGSDPCPHCGCELLPDDGDGTDAGTCSDCGGSL